MDWEFRDKPIVSASEDIYGIDKYINGLCEFIRLCSTPISISLQGEWGSGKTSMMNMLEERLCRNPQQGKRFDSIWVNAWELFINGDSENAVNKLVGEIVTQLGRKYAFIEQKKKSEERINEFKNYAKCIAKAVVNVSQINGDDLIETIFSGKEESVRELRSQFEAMLKVIIESNGSQLQAMLVFVDDLDRLNPELAVTLLETLKILFDVRNCIFVVAIDYDVVARGVEMKYGTQMLNQRNISKDYFDKMIQVPFTMPVLQYRIEDSLRTKLMDIGIFKSAEELDCVFDDMVAIVKHCTRSNPRTIKRYMNILLLAGIMDNDNIQRNGVNYKVLEALLVGIQMSFPTLYQMLLTNSDFKTWKRNLLLERRFLHAAEAGNLDNDADKEDAAYELPESVRKRHGLDSEWKEVLHLLAQQEDDIRLHYHSIYSLLDLFDRYTLRCPNKTAVKEIFGAIGLTSFHNASSNAVLYDGNRYNTSSQTQFKQGEKLLHRLDMDGVQTVLDVGCGTGLTTMELLALKPGLEIDAFDISDSQVQNAIKNYQAMKDKNGGIIRFFEMNALDLDCVNQYDLVFSNATLHWITKSRTMYTLLYNALKSGGKLAVHQGGRACYKGLHEKAVQAYCNLGLEEYYKDWHFPVFYPSRRECEELLRSIGFRDITVESLETDGSELPNLVENFKVASLILYREPLKDDAQYESLAEEFTRLCKEEGVDTYSNRLYIFARK